MIRIQEERELLGTRVSVVLVTEDELRGRAAVARAFEECERIEKAYSRFIEGNDLARLNASVGNFVSVSEELMELLLFAERMRVKTEGAFDISVKSILEGWGYDSAYSLREGTPGRVGSVEFLDGKVRLSAEVELGGLGKGYALDRMDSFLLDFPNRTLDAGGDILLRGKNEKGGPWKIAFEHPLNTAEAIGTVESTGLALACSSPSRRKWRNRHHIVDPARKEPADGMLAVYTQAEAGLLADAYSTALFVMGYEQAKSRLLELPVEAMLVGVDGRIFRSEGFLGELFKPGSEFPESFD